MAKISFESEDLIVDWVSLNLQGLRKPRIIAGRLSKYFTPHILIDGVPEIAFHGFRKKYKVYIQQSTGSKGYWIGTKIIFSGKNASYFYKLLKPRNFDWSHTNKSFDAFLLDSRSQIQYRTNPKYIKLQDFPDGKMLKVNRRNNSRHYRVYQKDETVRFELELKHRQTTLVQDYLFENQLDVFEHQLVIQYFQYSNQVLRSDYSYTDWILDFQRRYQATTAFRPLVASYLENEVIKNQEEEEKLFHLLQFLSFVKSLKLNPFKDCQKHKIKNQFYYELKFPLIKFVTFTGMQLSNYCEREKLIFYFYQLQKLGPIVKVFSKMAFQSYVYFPYVNCANPSGNSWTIEVLEDSHNNHLTKMKLYYNTIF